MHALALYVFALMVFLRPPDPRDVNRLRALEIQAIVTADAAEATPLPGRTPRETAAQLVAIAHLESGFVVGARGRDGEVGPWQLLHVPPTMRLRDQAREAIRRWAEQGPEGYTGERGGRCPELGCPLASHRRLAGAMLAATFPD